MKSEGSRQSAIRSGRTPHGVRGLESIRYDDWFPTEIVAPLTGCVD